MFNWKFVNQCYLYDGSFDGLLTIVFDSYVAGAIPVKIENISMYESNLLDSPYVVKTDPIKAKRIADGIVKKVSFNCLYNAYYAFCSEVLGRELAIVKYLLTGFNVGSKIDSMFSVDYILQVIKLRKKVLMEAHRLKGIIKLREIGNNLFYGPIHPTNNVIENIGHHLMKRLPTQNLILHDKNRNIAFLYNTKEYSMIDMPSDFTITKFSKQEQSYQELWKTFYQTIAIKERTNPRLQMQYLPKKYWEDLIEKP